MTPLLAKLRAIPPEAPWFLAKSPLLDQWRAHRDKTLPVLRDPQLAARNIGQIARHHFETTEQEYFDLRDLALPSTGSSVQWLEYQLPTRIHSEIGDQDLRDRPELHGHAGILMFEGPRVGAQGENIPEEATRLLVAEIFLEFAQPPRREGPHGSWVYAVDARGRILQPPSIHGFQTPEHNEYVRGLQGFFYPALLALAETPARRAARQLWDSGAGKTKIPQPKRARRIERTVGSERADLPERTGPIERAVARERTVNTERAVEMERTDIHERH